MHYEGNIQSVQIYDDRSHFRFNFLTEGAGLISVDVPADNVARSLLGIHTAFAQYQQALLKAAPNQIFAFRPVEWGVWDMKEAVRVRFVLEGNVDLSYMLDRAAARQFHEALSAALGLLQAPDHTKN
jgi:hypothetical protein